MLYRIHRMKDAPRENFRWASHAGGLAIIKPKDYDPAEEIEALSPYAAWIFLRENGAALHPGDVLEQIDAEGRPTALLIAKYIGFEPAQWFIPIAKDIANPGNQPDYSGDVSLPASFE